MAGVLGIVFVLLLVGVWRFYGRAQNAERELGDMMLQLRHAEEEKQSLERDSAYYQNPANLEKELRARFNYRAPDEKLIIVVPKPAATSTASHTP